MIILFDVKKDTQKCGDTNLPYSLIPFAEVEKQDMACFQRTEEILRGFLNVNPIPTQHHLPTPLPTSFTPAHHHGHTFSHSAPHAHSPLSHLQDAKAHSHNPIPSFSTSLPYPRAVSPPNAPMSTSPPTLHPPINNFGQSPTRLGPPRTTSPVGFMTNVNSPTFAHQPRTNSPIPNFPFSNESFFRPSYMGTPPSSGSLNLNPIYNLHGDEISRNFHASTSPNPYYSSNPHPYHSSPLPIHSSRPLPILSSNPHSSSPLPVHASPLSFYSFPPSNPLSLERSPPKDYDNKSAFNSFSYAKENPPNPTLPPTLPSTPLPPSLPSTPSLPPFTPNSPAPISSNGSFYKKDGKRERTEEEEDMDTSDYSSD
jgi:hypothetical protein